MHPSKSPLALPRRLRALGQTRAFTLIELLTVIAIIGVLAAILIPTIGRVRESAKSSRCTNNLRQVGIAIQGYVSDNKGSLPPGGAWLKPRFDADPRNFQTALVPYLDHVKTGYWGSSVTQSTYSPMFDCPGYKGENLLDARYSFPAGQVDYDGTTAIRPFGFMYQNPANGQFQTAPKPMKLASVPAKNEALTDRDFSTTERNHPGHRNSLYYDWHVGRVAVSN